MWPQFVAVKKTSEPRLGLSLADREGLHSWPSPGVTPHLLLLLSAEAAVTETGMMCMCSPQAPSHGLAGFILFLSVSLCSSVMGLS